MSTRTDDADEIAEYYAAGRERAFELGNRGPVRFVGDGALHPDIVEAYWRTGFYVFEGLIDDNELADIESDLEDFRARLPTERGAAADAHGRPAIGAGGDPRWIAWAKPLSDPLGGRTAFKGRHPTKMAEPDAAADAPDEVVYVVQGTLQHCDAHLRLYGHPDLLGIAAAINGDDFTPFNEVIFIKDPGVGPSVAWHRDGVTHWDSPDWDQGTHGFNLMAQVHGCVPENGVWVLPGSHKVREIDIAALRATAGSDRLPDLVPLICEPGDVAIVNRQAVHGSFANTASTPRVTLNLGFHRRASVLGAQGSGIHGDRGVLDAERIARRSEMIGWGIAARTAHYPDETPFDYAPLRGRTFEWNDAARDEIAGYNRLDLSI